MTLAPEGFSHGLGRRKAPCTTAAAFALEALHTSIGVRATMRSAVKFSPASPCRPISMGDLSCGQQLTIHDEECRCMWVNLQVPGCSHLQYH
jgi:hypothetical protein